MSDSYGDGQNGSNLVVNGVSVTLVLAQVLRLCVLTLPQVVTR